MSRHVDQRNNNVLLHTNMLQIESCTKSAPTKTSVNCTKKLAMSGTSFGCLSSCSPPGSMLLQGFLVPLPAICFVNL